MQGLENLLTGALKRHGIAIQVTATVIVARANEVLAVLLMGTPMQGDVTVVAYKEQELIIACPHAAASYDVNGFLPALQAELERQFPDKTFSRIVTRIVPAAWYNGGIV